MNGFITILLLLFGPQIVSAQNKTKEKLFTVLSSEQTNITFNNKIKDEKDRSILLYSNYYGGGGVGIGDINNDGLQDIYFTGNLVGDQLYLNKGNMVFEDISKKAGIADNGSWTSGVIMGDVNNDGYTDIYVTCELYDFKPELRHNKLYINNGDNTFTESAKAYGIDDNQRTRHAIFLDYDKDGDLDLYLLNQPPNPGDYSPFYNTELLKEEFTARLYQNRGNIFVDVTKEAGLINPSFPNSATASDFNGDGWTDIYVANDYWMPDCMYINNGNGTFTNEIHERLKHITFSSMGVDAGDINNDCKLDLFVLDMVPEDYYRRKTNMGGPGPRSHKKMLSENGHYQYFTNTLQLNLGNNHYSEISQLAGISFTDWSWSQFFADLDNDGWKDIFIANGLMMDIRDNDAAIKFPDYIHSSINDYLANTPEPGEISIWEIANMNKAFDFYPSVKLSNYIFKNNGDLTFTKMTEEFGADQKTFSNGCGYADLDNDGDLDIVVNNINDKASVFQNNNDKISGNNYIRINPVAESGNVPKIGVKVWIETSDGKQFFEITGARGMYSSSEQVAHFGIGDTKEIDKITIQWPDGNKNILTNKEANHTIDVKYSKSKPIKNSPVDNIKPIFTKAEKQTGIQIEHIENEFDDFQLQTLLPHKQSTMGPCIAVGDINGDNLDDFFMGGAIGQPAQVMIQNANGTFTKQENEIWETDKNYEDVGAAFFDADGDNDSDLYVVSGGNEYRFRSTRYTDRLYINKNGTFTKTEGLIPIIKTSGSKVYPEDFDNDGDIDLFVAGHHMPGAYPWPTSSSLLVNNGGTFTNGTKNLARILANIGIVNDATWVDFNDDGRKDLVLVGEWMPITFLKNSEDGFINVTENYGMNNSKGWWFSIDTADFDSDGDIDFVAGNLGLNYRYKSSAQDPFEVYSYDFDNNGKNDIILTHFENGEKYPLRRKECLTEQTPSLETKFPTFKQFAKSDVYELFGLKNLDKSLHYSTNTFATSYIENKDNGQFEVKKLPLRAQFSSVNDFIIDDFNRDGNKDILLAGNLFNSEVRTPRNDAGYGLLLIGNGKGEFTEEHLTESGFFVPYNVKSLAQINNLILVGCNNDSLKVFKFEK
ncbi:MAG: VCBS repeat-containing protein [Bacteroidota bacterium]